MYAIISSYLERNTYLFLFSEKLSLYFESNIYQLANPSNAMATFVQGTKMQRFLITI